MAKRKAAKDSPASSTRGRTILYTVAAVVALAGLADATYLTASALSGETATCGGSAGCFEVLGSAYARIAGIPTAAFGVLGYFSAFTFAILPASVTRVLALSSLLPSGLCLPRPCGSSTSRPLSFTPFVVTASSPRRSPFFWLVLSWLALVSVTRSHFFAL